MIAALIIAAGKTAHREGFEPHREVGSISAVQRIVMVFQRAGIERVAVVCDQDKLKIEKTAAQTNVVFLHGSADNEMFENVKIGLAYLQDKCDAAVITHPDVPLFSDKTVRALAVARGEICVPAHGGRAGHPMLLRASCFPVVLSYLGEGGLAGAADAAEASGLERRFVDVDDEGVLTNVHYEADYEQLLSEHILREICPDVRISLVRERSFYDPDVHQLLQLTEETGSLREACRRMGMSYSKGRGIMALIEQQLGYSVIESRQGGKDGGYSIVTAEGKELARKYSDFCARAHKYMDELFAECFAP